MNLYVGNLSPKTSEYLLRKMFELYGKVDTISMNEKPLNDTEYRFCFVNMPFENQASYAIKGLDGKKLNGNVLSIKESALRAYLCFS